MRKNLSSYRNRKRPARRGYTTVARTRGVYAAGEMKYFDTEKGLTSVASQANWTGTEQDPTTFNTLFVPVKGSGINERIGRKVNVMKIRIKGTVVVAPQADQTSGDGRSVIRLALVEDTQTNGTQMQGEDVMDGNTSTTATAVNAFQSLDNLGRFRVLKDKTIVMQNPNFGYDGTNLEQQGLARTFKMNIILKKPITVSFNEVNGGTIADIVDNSWHMIANCDNASLVPQLTYVARVYYKE